SGWLMVGGALANGAIEEQAGWSAALGALASGGVDEKVFVCNIFSSSLRPTARFRLQPQAAGPTGEAPARRLSSR
ncbi:MAG: hypothetical protein LC713_04575, partial [Actinobacteria bacterium]|nr:hypothetical protein [Actinomycetota bacterium]